jgi:hypothetical protein
MTTETSVPQTQTAPQPEPYINKAEVARRLGKEVRTIDNWMRQGKIPYFNAFMRERFRVVRLG